MATQGTVLLDDGSGFAICHVGPGTEAGTGACFIKFAAARTGSLDSLARLLDACETFATAQGSARRSTRSAELVTI